MIRAWATHRGHSELAYLFVYGFLAGVRRADFAIYFFAIRESKAITVTCNFHLGDSMLANTSYPRARISFHERHVLNACGVVAFLRPRSTGTASSALPQR